jgi:hypothetical protein
MGRVRLSRPLALRGSCTGLTVSASFRGVPEPVWNFHIGGYQVCEKWLKDRRGRRLTKSDLEHYQKIVVAIQETMRLMEQIDRAIEEHGGWPGAFQVKTTYPTATEPALTQAAEPRQRPYGGRRRV